MTAPMVQRLQDEAEYCDLLGITKPAALLREAAAEIDRLRAAIARACAGYPADDAAPTCVAILRADLGPNARLSGAGTASA